MLILFKFSYCIVSGLATKSQSEYENPVQWSETIENTSKRFFRTPNNYGFYVMSL